MLKKTYIKVVQNTIHKITDMLIIKKKFTGRKYQKLRGKTIIINSLSWSIIGVSLYPPITD